MSPRLSHRARCAIVTLRVPRADWVEATSASVAHYAARHGLEVVALREERLDMTVLKWRRRDRNLHLEKFQIHDLLADYDRVLYVDADVLIHPDAPNLFEQVPECALGVVNEQVGAEAHKRRQEWAAMQGRLGSLGHTPSRYFNAGVMVVSRPQRALFAYRGRAFAAGRWPDQNTLNYYAVRDQVPVCWLDPDWNCMPVFADRFGDAARRRKSWMIHYAGEHAKAALPADLDYFYARRPACAVS